jgi:hypothetical protein
VWGHGIRFSGAVVNSYEHGNEPSHSVKDEEFLNWLINNRPPLWSSGQRSWLQIQRSGFDSWRYQIF